MIPLNRLNQAISQETFTKLEFPAASSPQYRSKLVPFIPPHLSSAAPSSTSKPLLLRRIRYCSPPSPFASSLSSILESTTEEIYEKQEDHKEQGYPQTASSISIQNSLKLPCSTSTVALASTSVLSSHPFQRRSLLPAPPPMPLATTKKSPKKAKAKCIAKTHTPRIRSKSEDLTHSPTASTLSSTRPQTAATSLAYRRSLHTSLFLSPHVMTMPSPPAQINPIQNSLVENIPIFRRLFATQEKFLPQEQGRPFYAQSNTTCTRVVTIGNKPPEKQTTTTCYTSSRSLLS